MGAIVDVGQVLEVEMGVDLCGADIGMAKQLLDGPQITAGFEDMRGKGVAQHMRVNGLIEPLATGQLAEPSLDAAMGQPLAPAADKKGRFLGIGDRPPSR